MIGAGATIRLEYGGLDQRTHYFVPKTTLRAWEFGDEAYGSERITWVRDLYIRACLTNTDRPAHHCGPAA